MLFLTLGSQVSKLAAMVARLNSNEWLAHPPVDPQDAQAAAELLKEVRYLVAFRNRLMHDVWYVYPTEDCHDAIEGHPPTRWAQKTVHSSIRTVHVIYGLLSIAGAAVSDVEEQIIARELGRAARHDLGNVRRLAASIADVKRGANPVWRWEERR